MCGIQKPLEGHPLAIGWVVNNITVWWFAVASEGSPKVNLSPLRPWRAPRWLARDRQEPNELLEKYTDYLLLRVNCAIIEAIDLAEVRRASNPKAEENKGEPAEAEAGATKKEEPIFSTSEDLPFNQVQGRSLYAHPKSGNDNQAAPRSLPQGDAGIGRRCSSFGH